MRLTLQRKTVSDKSTLGELHVNGAFFCFSLEDVIRRGPKVYGKTAIPAGTYEIAITHSNRFKCLMPLLLSVPGFEGIRIHLGNTAENTLGCILVGCKKGPDWIGESRAAYQALFQELCAANSREKITIEILNPPGWDAPTQARTVPLAPARHTAPQHTSGGPITGQIQPVYERDGQFTPRYELADDVESRKPQAASILAELHDRLNGSGRSATNWAIAAIAALPAWHVIVEVARTTGVELPKDRAQWFALLVAVGRLLIQKGK